MPLASKIPSNAFKVGRPNHLLKMNALACERYYYHSSGLQGKEELLAKESR